MQPVILELDSTGTKVLSTTFLAVPRDFGSVNKNWTVFRHKGKWLIDKHSYTDLIFHEFEYDGGVQCKLELCAEVARLSTLDFFADLKGIDGPVPHLRGTSNWLTTAEGTYLTVLHFSLPATLDFVSVIFKTYRSVFAEFDGRNFRASAQVFRACVSATTARMCSSPRPCCGSTKASGIASRLATDSWTGSRGSAPRRSRLFAT